MIAAVVGYGSIGSRHTRILTNLTDKVIVVSRRKINQTYHYFTLEDMFRHERPNYIVIANKTNEHSITLNQLIKHSFRGMILVEKPLIRDFSQKIDLDGVFVAYNLRFHPVIQRLKQELSSEKILSVNVYAGQYLPSWRPKTDYRKCYSAKKEEGGGVLRDLSHEFDYLMMMFGNWKSVAAIGGKVSQLDISSEDTYSILIEFEKCSNVTIHLNYLDRIKQRKIIINTERKTIIADLISNTLQINDEFISYSVNRDDTYIAQHEAMLKFQGAGVCTYEQGLEVVNLIESIEYSSMHREWLFRD